jgi:hypothetical protein
LRLEPDNVDVPWKVSRAYEKKEDWQQVVVALAHAARLAPHVTRYRRWHGNAYIERDVLQEAPQLETLSGATRRRH